MNEHPEAQNTGDNEHDQPHETDMAIDFAELERVGIRISMDGRGRCRDNAKLERFWWALKYEDIKIKEYVSLPQLRFGVQHYANFYNARRLHSALQYQTPDEVYFGTCNAKLYIQYYLTPAGREAICNWRSGQRGWPPFAF